MTVYSGNFVRELIIPNSLQISSLRKLGKKLWEYKQKHQGKEPDYIRVNRRQIMEYKSIFPPQYTPNDLNAPMTFNGIPLMLYAKTRS